MNRDFCEVNCEWYLTKRKIGDRSAVQDVRKGAPTVPPKENVERGETVVQHERHQRRVLEHWQVCPSTPRRIASQRLTAYDMW